MTTACSSSGQTLVMDSPLGPIRITADDTAIRKITWIAEEEAKRHIPTPSSEILERARVQLDAYFRRQRQHFDLPVAPGGTDFQRRVWALLTSIPYGQTMTYGEAARRLSTSARALGQACGRNPIPIIIPCHRIVGAGNKIGGFSALGGIDTKRLLIQLERLTIE